MNEVPAIRLQGLVKRYGSLTAVDNVDLEVPSGQILALLGPNGAGKSTTTEMILGLTTPDAGRVEIFGQPTQQAVRSGDVGAMLQNGTLLWDTSVSSVLRLVRGLQAHPLPLGEVIERADLTDILTSSTSKLSGGQAQRVRFALAIMANPRLLLLDEPTVGFDVEARRRFWSTMEDFIQDGRTVVFATHYLDEADAFADRIVVLRSGRIVADGSGADIKSVVAGRRVTFTGPAGDWAALPGVNHVEHLADRWQLSCTDSDAALRALLTNEDVRDVEVTAPRLEDAFVELVSA